MAGNAGIRQVEIAMEELVEGDIVVEKLTANQSRLYAYIYSLTHDAHVAWDLLQETNRVIWGQAEQYDIARQFLPWALRFAFNQVRTWRKQQRREKLCFHDESTLLAVEQSVKSRVLKQTDERSVALEECVEKLAENQQQLVRRVYHDGESLADIARDRASRVNTIAVHLHRIRTTLAECIKLRTQAS